MKSSLKWLPSQICYEAMYVKIIGHLESIKRIELTSVSTFIVLHNETETRTQNLYVCPSETVDHHHLPKLFPSDIYIASDFVCGNRDFLI